MSSPKPESPTTYTVGRVVPGAPCCEPIPQLRITRLGVSYGNTRVLNEVSLDIYKGCNAA